MSHGLFYWSPCYVSGRWMCWLHCCLWEGQRMHQKYLKLCSEDERSFYEGLERHGGKWFMTKFSFWGGGKPKGGKPKASSLWHSTEAVAFFSPRPRPYFPCLLSPRLVSSHLLRDSLCTALQTEKLWNWSTGLSTQLTPSSRREAWVRGNLTALPERSQLATRWTHGRDGGSCV